MPTQTQKRYLVGADFDETSFHTFSPSPNGMNVQKAYCLSLDDIFGKGTGEWFFTNIGLNNKAPSQIIGDLFSRAEEHKQRLLSNALSFFEAHEGHFGNLIPECRDGTLFWNSDFPEAAIIQMLILKKLEYLMAEIGNPDIEGKIWPQPCKGFLEFTGTVSQLKKENVPIDTAIISSGHEAFIKKVFETWNIPQPDILVTEDDIRPRLYPNDPQVRFKPGAFPLALAHYKWLRKQEETSASRFRDAQDSKKRIFYIGDDPHKDGLMAKNCKITGGIFPIISWEEITASLKQNHYLMDGRPIEEMLIFAKKSIEFEGRGHGNRERL